MVAALRLDEHSRDFGVLSLNTTLDAGHDGLHFVRRMLSIELDAEGSQHVSRAEVHGQDLVWPRHGRRRLYDLSDAAADFRRCRLLLSAATGTECLALGVHGYGLSG